MSDRCHLSFVDNRRSKTLYVMREPPDVELVIESFNGENDVTVRSRWKRDWGTGLRCAEVLGKLRPTIKQIQDPSRQNELKAYRLSST